MFWRNKLERALRDCPWMWAVNAHWGDGHEITFRNMNPLDAYLRCDAEFEWWAMYSQKDGYAYKEVIMVPRKPGLILAEAVFFTHAMENRALKYLVCHEITNNLVDRGKYQILKAPKDQTLFNICRSASNETERMREAQALGHVGMA
jgi:hypothetical protein